MLHRRTAGLSPAAPADLVAALEAAPPLQPRPGWWVVLQDLPAPDPIPDSAETPLARLTSPLVRRAWEILATRVTVAEAFTSSAVTDLTTDLTSGVTQTMQTCIDTEWRRARSGWVRFCDELLRDRLLSLWHRYPALARLVGTQVLSWVDDVAALVDDLQADRDALARLCGGFPPRRIAAVSPGLSDPHHGGRYVRVVSLETESGGAQLVHKPRDLTSDQVWSAALRWAEERGLDAGSAPRLVAGANHGWVEFIASRPIDDPDLYFRRAGAVTALLYALGGNDCHAENVIAAGAHPVVIDSETVLQPTIRQESGTAGRDNVLDTLMLPRWMRIGGRAVDLSALGAAPSGGGWERRALMWRDAGTDEARLVPHSTVIDVTANAARDARGNLLSAGDHEEAFLAGFAQAWREVTGNPESFLTSIDGLRHTRVRVLVRMTRTYTRIRETSLSPALLETGLRRSIHLEHLARYVLDRQDWQSALPLVDAERDQLEIGDIPYFTAGSGDEALRDEGGQPLLPFTESAWGRTHRRVHAMTAAELGRQERLIRASLAVAPVGVRSRELASAPRHSDPETPGSEDLLRAATRQVLSGIMEQLASFDVSLVAVGPGQWGFEPLAAGWYDGATGLAVALIGAGQALSDDAARRHGLDLIERELALAGRLAPRWWQRGPGGQDGVGGLLYGWSLVAELMPAYRAAIGEAVRHVLDAAPPAQEMAGADLLGGSLGLLGGLVALTRVGVNVDVSVAHRVHAATREAVSRRLDGAPIVNGFSHGSSGMAAVLAAADRAGWGPAGGADDVVAGLLRAEADRYDADLGDWPDLRGPGRRRPAPGWCNGAPGMALARVLAADPCGDLSRLRPLLTTDVDPRDNLCCGSAGRVEVLRLLATAGQVDPAQYAGAAHGLALRALSGSLRLGVPRGCELQPLGLFQGVAGPLLTLSGAVDRSIPNPLRWC